MLRVQLAIVLIIATIASATTQQLDQPALVARAQDVVARLVSGEVEPLLPTLTDRMKVAIDADGLRRFIPGISLQFGAPSNRRRVLDSRRRV